MTDLCKVYTKVLKSIKAIVKDQHPGHTITLAMMITGIVLSKKKRNLLFRELVLDDSLAFLDCDATLD